MKCCNSFGALLGLSGIFLELPPDGATFTDDERLDLPLAEEVSGMTPVPDDSTFDWKMTLDSIPLLIPELTGFDPVPGITDGIGLTVDGLSLLPEDGVDFMPLDGIGLIPLDGVGLIPLDGLKPEEESGAIPDDAMGVIPDPGLPSIPDGGPEVVLVPDGLFEEEEFREFDTSELSLEDDDG